MEMWKKLVFYGVGAVVLGGLVHLHEWKSAKLDAATGTKIRVSSMGDTLHTKIANEIAAQMDSDGSFTDINVDSGNIDGTAIGANSASTGAFTTLSATGAFSATGSFNATGLWGCGTETITLSSADPGVGTATLTTLISGIVSDATGTGTDTCSLLDGTTGQIKIINLVIDGETTGTAITPVNFAQGTDILFEDAGDGCILYFDGTNWQLVGNNGGTVR